MLWLEERDRWIAYEAPKSRDVKRSPARKEDTGWPDLNWLVGVGALYSILHMKWIWGRVLHQKLVEQYIMSTATVFTIPIQSVVVTN
jgi:hypothetical protein